MLDEKLKTIVRHDYYCMLYLQAVESNQLDMLERLWKIADQEPELQRAFRQVHEDLGEEEWP